MIIVNARFLTQKVSGVQRFAIELSKELKKRNAKIVFVTPSNILNHDLAAELEAQVIGYFKGHIWEQLDLPRFVNKHKSLLVNLMSTGPVFSKNHIATLHDVTFLKFPRWFSFEVVLFYKLTIPIFTRKAKHVVTVSEFSKREISNYLNVASEKITVIHNSVNFLQHDTPPKFNLVEENYILAVGSLDPRKNLIRLMEAFGRMKKFEKLKLVIIGDEKKIFSVPDYSEFRSESICFSGYLSDEQLMSAYAGASLFVYPSLYEGFGIPPLEAMHYGCPVVCSNVASLPEICGDAALYIDPLDVEDIVEKMTMILTNKTLKINLIKKGKKQLSKFNWSDSAIKLEEIIEKCSME